MKTISYGDSPANRTAYHGGASILFGCAVSGVVAIGLAAVAIPLAARISALNWIHASDIYNVLHDTRPDGIVPGDRFTVVAGKEQFHVRVARVEPLSGPVPYKQVVTCTAEAGQGVSNGAGRTCLDWEIPYAVDVPQTPAGQRNPKLAGFRLDLGSGSR